MFSYGESTLLIRTKYKIYILYTSETEDTALDISPYLIAAEKEECIEFLIRMDQRGKKKDFSIRKQNI